MVLWLSCTDFTVKGQFGDAFGSLNTLFSGLAFAAFVYTVLLQRHELELQRIEMELTRSELSGQKAQLSLQNDLTILSARLSAIPLLIQQEALSIQKHGGQFNGWAERAYSVEELAEQIEEGQKNLVHYTNEYQNAVQLAEQHKSTDVFNDYGRVVIDYNVICTRYEKVIPKLKHLQLLQSDLDSIYKKLSDAQKTSTFG